MKSIIFILNLTGLTCDLIGFWGLYNLKIKPPREIPSRYILRMQDGSIDDAINSSLKLLSDSLKINDQKSLKFFVFILIGFALQILSQIFIICL